MMNENQFEEYEQFEMAEERKIHTISFINVP